MNGHLDSLREELALQRDALMRSFVTSGTVLPPLTPVQRLAVEHYLSVSSDLQLLEAQKSQQEQRLLETNRPPILLSNRHGSTNLDRSTVLTSSPSPAVAYQELSSLSSASQDQETSSAEESVHFKLPAKFLESLVKMIKNDINGDILEWKDGLLNIYRPVLLEKELLPKYFRHAKLTSFQRQLNYFGFHKFSGFGLYNPCSYENKDTTNDIQSILRLKRNKKKKGAAAQKIANMNQAKAADFGNGNLKILSTVSTERLSPGGLEPSTRAVTPPNEPCVLHRGLDPWHQLTPSQVSGGMMLPNERHSDERLFLLHQERQARARMERNLMLEARLGRFYFN